MSLIPPSSPIMTDSQQRQVEASIFVLDEHCVEAGRRIDVSLRESDEKWDKQIIRVAKEESASLDSVKGDEIHMFKIPPNLMKGMTTRQKMAALVKRLRVQLAGLSTSDADEFVELMYGTIGAHFPALSDEENAWIFILPKPHSKSLSMHKITADGESKDMDLLVRVDCSNTTIRANRTKNVSSILDLLKDKVTGLETTNASNYVFLRFDPPLPSGASEQTINEARTEQIQDLDQPLCNIFPLPPKIGKISLLICNRKSSESRKLHTLMIC